MAFARSADAHQIDRSLSHLDTEKIAAMTATKRRLKHREILFGLVLAAASFRVGWCFSARNHFFRWDSAVRSRCHHGRLPANNPNADVFRRKKDTASNRPLFALNPSVDGILSSLPSIIATEKSINAAATAMGFGILSVYHTMLVLKERQGKQTWRSVQADAREKWSRFVRATEGWLYAIQTMRNAITAMTFLASTVLSLLTVITGRLWEVVRNLPQTDSYRRLLVLQFASVAVCMLSSAYHFLQSARMMTHAGFMFPVENRDSTKVDRIMRKSQNAQWLGLRWLYVSLGIISWVVGGPRVFLVTSLLLNVFFRQIDRVPEGLGSDCLDYTI